MRSGRIVVGALAVAVAGAGVLSVGVVRRGDEREVDDATASPRRSRPSPGAVHGDVWRPAPGVTWQWQLSGLPVDTEVRADVFVVDGFDSDAALVDLLHSQGRRVVCYLSFGTWEQWRPDADAFPAGVVGAELEEWPGERWLDVRRAEALEPVWAARLDMCRAKGFDGVEADNVDGHEAETGFPATASDQITFNRRIAALAHERGLAVALKNDAAQVPDLVDDFDFAIVEECVAHDECEAYRRFVEQGKAVLHAEYDQASFASICALARRLGFSSILKERELTAWRRAC